MWPSLCRQFCSIIPHTVFSPSMGKYVSSLSWLQVQHSYDSNNNSNQVPTVTSEYIHSSNVESLVIYDGNKSDAIQVNLLECGYCIIRQFVDLFLSLSLSVRCAMKWGSHSHLPTVVGPCLVLYNANPCLLCADCALCLF